MIAKNLKKPIFLLQLEALLPRVSPMHPTHKDITATFKKRMAGYRGEQALEYPLSFLSGEKYTILYNLRLLDAKYYFQLDILLLSLSYFLNIEVKNIKGTLYFDANSDQVIRTYNDKKEAISDPILQAERHKSQLKAWMLKLKLPHVPIEYIVVMSRIDTILKASPGNEAVFQKVIQSAKVPDKIREFENVHIVEKLTKKDITKISRRLIKYHTPYDADILKKFSVSKPYLLTGVGCPNCSFLPMKRMHGKWCCPSCSHASKDAHIAALKDYYLLLGSTISNQELREFLHLPSEKAAHTLLNSMDLNHSGNNKGRRYHLPHYDD